MSNFKSVSGLGISIVIPNYNGRKLFPVTLPTVLEALKTTQLPFEIIVSDDASTDDSVPFLQSHYPQVIVLTSITNSGFSVTINKGIHSASYSYILLLNSDVKLTPTYIQLLLPYFNDPYTFGVMGRIIGWDNDSIQDGGKLFKYQGFKLKTSYNYVPQQHNEQGLPSFYLSGANALVSREKILSIGGFNELFSPFYVEDTELGIRAWRRGWVCYYEHQAICRHQLSASVKTAAQAHYVKEIYNRNKLFLHALHLPQAKLLLWRMQLSLERLIHKLLGRSYFENAFIEYKKKQSILKSTRLAFENTPNVLSIDEVKKKYDQLLNNKPITIFKR